MANAKKTSTSTKKKGNSSTKGSVYTPPNASKELPLSYYAMRHVKRSSVEVNSELPDL